MRSAGSGKAGAAGEPAEADLSPNPETSPPLPADLLVEQTYRELHRIAARCMRSQPPDHTLQPTALVHEAYLRLSAAGFVGWHGRGAFLAVAASVMRQVLIDAARRRHAAKRDVSRRVTLVDGSALAQPRSLDLLALDEALRRLAVHDARAAAVVELRFFGGLDTDEAAAVLGVGSATVKRDWRFARAWLGRELAETAGPPP